MQRGKRSFGGMFDSSLGSSLILGWAVLFVLVACYDASAQNRRPVRRPRRSSFSDQPALSPYLSLLNNNADVGQNYAALTGPMLQQQEASARNAQAISRLQYDTGEVGAYGVAGGLRATGHRSSFMNFSHYYGDDQSGMGGGGGTFQRRRRSPSGGGGMMGGFGIGGMGMGGMGMGF